MCIIQSGFRRWLVLDQMERVLRAEVILCYHLELMRPSCLVEVLEWDPG